MIIIVQVLIISVYLQIQAIFGMNRLTFGANNSNLSNDWYILMLNTIVAESNLRAYYLRVTCSNSPSCPSPTLDMNQEPEPQCSEHGACQSVSLQISSFGKTQKISGCKRTYLAKFVKNSAWFRLRIYGLPHFWSTIWRKSSLFGIEGKRLKKSFSSLIGFNSFGEIYVRRLV